MSERQAEPSATVLDFPAHHQRERIPDCQCRTVGSLLNSIAYLIERGEYDTALRQARECERAYADVPLPDIPEDE